METTTDTVTPYEKGRAAATKALKRRLKAKQDPILAQPSHKTITANSEGWQEFVRGWVSVMKEYKESLNAR